MIFSAHAKVCGGDWSRILLIMAHEGNEFLNVRLVAHNGFTVCLRCRGNEFLVEIVSPRHLAGELAFPCLRTLAQPGRDARREAADNRSGKRR